MSNVWSLQSQYPEKDAWITPDAGAQLETDALVSVTAQHWRGEDRGPTGRAAADGADYASGSVRDRFLDALDSAETGPAVEIARHLLTCGNPLPSATCVALGLPSGSSYGAGARAVLAKTTG